MCVGVACEVPLRRRTYKECAMVVRLPSSVGMLPVKSLLSNLLLGEGMVRRKREVHVSVAGAWGTR